MTKLVACLFAVSLSLAAPTHASSYEFPPGLFSDGGGYEMADFEGKVLVLFFYESGCPRCKGSIPGRNEIVKKFAGKPVKFIAVAPGDSTNSIASYIRSTKLAMPVFADQFGLLQGQFGIEISLRNIWQTRIIGPTGRVVGQGFTEEAINGALRDVDWTYNTADFDKRLHGVVEQLEWNQHARALPKLMALARSSPDPVKGQAQKLLDDVIGLGKGWIGEAEKAVEDDPVKAYELYEKVERIFKRHHLAKEVAKPLKELEKHEKVKAELDARRTYKKLASAIKRARPTLEHKRQIASFCATQAKKHEGTPTGALLKRYADLLRR